MSEHLLYHMKEQSHEHNLSPRDDHQFSARDDHTPTDVSVL